jgi:hypothetical protein
MANCMLVRQLTSGDDSRSSVQVEYALLRIGCQSGWNITKRVVLSQRPACAKKQLKTGFGRAYLKRRLD